MRELQTGIWHWEATHADWTPEDGGEDGWGPEVSSYAIDDGARLLLFDPVAPPSLVEELASGRTPLVVLTCSWHARDARSLVEGIGAHICAPPDSLPAGVQAFPGNAENDHVLWVESHRALVIGDSLVDLGRGLELPDGWLRKDRSREEVLDVLRPLLDLRVELVLPTHGAPTDRDALERALAR